MYAVCALLFTLSRTVFALNCYGCSQTDSDKTFGTCAESVDDTTVSIPCSSDSNSCEASKATTGSSITYDRRCQFNCEPGTVNSSLTTTETKCCKGDNCNGNFGSIVPFQCYSCSSSTNPVHCGKNQMCLSSQNYCRTTKVVSGTTTTYERGCTASCKGGTVENTTTTCCQTNLCNTNAGAIIAINLAVLLLAALIAFVVSR
eukprot:m.43471 g.43471  ORF g.43471 m.43471 type:complete len:202 (+) comp33437_c0_seq1:111-716(+)